MLTVGADPELFVSRDGAIISAIGMIGGTKHDPVPVKCGALQEDNVLAEFNINPAQDEDEFVCNIQTVMAQLHDVVGETTIKSWHEYEREQLKSFGPSAMEFGCDSDFNAWELRWNGSPSPYTTLRTAAGHIHLGYDNPGRALNILIARALDVYLGVPSVVMEPVDRRRELYGGAGSIRHKPYGVEYRTLSNFWLKNEALMRWVFRSTLEAYKAAPKIKEKLDDFGPAIQSTINNNDYDQAVALCHEFDLKLEEAA